MVTLQCEEWFPKIETYISRRLENDSVHTLVLALPEVTRLDIPDSTRTPDTSSAFHNLPGEYPQMDLGVCIPVNVTSTRDIYENAADITVIDVRSVPEKMVISNREIYFSAGETEHGAIVRDTTNLCDHEASIEDCLEYLFEIRA